MSDSTTPSNIDGLWNFHDTAESDGYEELGECLLASGHADEAAPHFVRVFILVVV